MTRIEVLINIALARTYPCYVGTNDVMDLIQAQKVPCTKRTINRHLKQMAQFNLVEILEGNPNSYRYAQRIGQELKGKVT